MLFKKLIRNSFRKFNLDSCVCLPLHHGSQSSGEKDDGSNLLSLSLVKVLVFQNHKHLDLKKDPRPSFGILIRLVYLYHVGC